MKHKACWIVSISLLLVIGGAYFVSDTYEKICEIVRDYYAQWAAAELVIAYHAEQGALPLDWDSLKPYETMTRHASFEDIRARIQIDFASLDELSQVYASEDAVPEIITTVSGTRSHWESAEPNVLVNAALTVRDSLTP